MAPWKSLSILFAIITNTVWIHAAVIPQAKITDSKSLDSTSNDEPLPLIIWHGLGDSYATEGMSTITTLAEATNPGTFTYVIRLDEDAVSDRSVTFFGNVSAQIEKVCGDLAAHPILSTAPAVDALGFSQGGQFLRGYVERCNFPPVRSLVTFGAQHNGINKFQVCEKTDFLCRVAQGFLRYNIWTSFVQSYIVPSQYFRNPSSESEYNSYLENSNFLADINNEREKKNSTYKSNLTRLHRFVMYLFEKDETVVPKESAWFTEVNGTSITPLQERAMYKEDWIGLRVLDEKGALRFKTAPGPHMNVTPDILKQAFQQYFGPLNKKFEDDNEPKIDDSISLEL